MPTAAVLHFILESLFDLTCLFSIFYFSAVDCVDHTQVHSCKPREVVIFGENQEENVVYLVKIVEIEIERYQGTLKAPIYVPTLVVSG